LPDTPFQSLSSDDRLAALRVAAENSGRQAYLLEKDIWVVQTLAALVEAPFGRHLTFKGGTSLSKAYRAIRRFSEDLDITYDIRTLAPNIGLEDGDEFIPKSRKQAKKWTKNIRTLLASWVAHEALPAINSSFHKFGTAVQSRVEEDCIYITYNSLFTSGGFVKPEVKIEFGARSTGEPRTEFSICCDAAEHLPGFVFPTAISHVMLAERTFWEKATAVHVSCRQRKLGSRMSRHWHDLVRLDDSGYADKALDTPQIAITVASHKAMLYREKDSENNLIDYKAAVSGDLQLVPGSEVYGTIAADYNAMMDSGMLMDSDEKFDDLMQRCDDIQKRANNRHIPTP
jgi:hypothetical protein